MRVVVADRQPLFRRGVADVIADEPDLVVVGETDDASCSSTVVTRGRADVVLLDLGYAGGGVEACARLRDARPEVRVVVLAHADDDADLAGAVRAGARGYLLQGHDARPSSCTPCARSPRAARCSRRRWRPACSTSSRCSCAARTAPAEGTGALSRRELEVLTLVAQGLNNRAIAETLFISENTVKNHVRNIHEKLQVHSRMEAVVRAVREGSSRSPERHGRRPPVSAPGLGSAPVTDSLLASPRPGRSRCTPRGSCPVTPSLRPSLAARAGRARRTAAVEATLRRLGAVQLDTVSVLARSHELVQYARLGAVGREAVETAYWGGGPGRPQHPDRRRRSSTGRTPRASSRSRSGRCSRSGGGPTRGAASTGTRSRRGPSRRCASAGRRTGPLTTTELGGAKKGDEWWDWSETKIAVEWLLFLGEVVCVRRVGWRRVYDLAERAIPAEHRAPAPGLGRRRGDRGPDRRRVPARAAACAPYGSAASAPSPTSSTSTGWRLARRRALTRSSVCSASSSRPGACARVEVQGWAAAGVRRQRGRSTRSAPGGSRGRSRTTLLSPFDSLVWHRGRTSRLFGFDYQMELYVSRRTGCTATSRCRCCTAVGSSRGSIPSACTTCCTPGRSPSRPGRAAACRPRSVTGIAGGAARGRVVGGSDDGRGRRGGARRRPPRRSRRPRGGLSPGPRDRAVRSAHADGRRGPGAAPLRALDRHRCARRAGCGSSSPTSRRCPRGIRR